MPDVQEVFRMATQKVRPDPGALERQNRNQRRHSIKQRAGAYALVAVLVIAAVLIGVLALQQRDTRPASQPEREAPTAAELATKPYFLELDTGEATLLPESLEGGYSYAASPDGTRLAYNSNEGGGCVEGGITVANIDGSDVRTIESPEGLTMCGARWSFDGTKLVYQERDAANESDVGNLFVHDLTTGQRTQITDLELTNAWWWFLSPRFTDGGRNVIFHLPRSSSQTTTWDVWSVPVTGGEPTLLLRNAAFPMLHRSCCPEGEEIAFVQPLPNDFSGQSIMTGRPVPGSDLRSTLVDANSSIWWPTRSPDGMRIAYQDGGSIYVVDIGPVVRGEPSKVADGNTAEWLDNDTLIVTPVS
jgi:dipeptidyl aminopeptidase/acylaminoacyl peptidase